MNQKIITVQLPNGFAKLAFTKKDGNIWTCSMSDQTINDLEAYLEGRVPREIVRWNDLGDLGE